MGLSKNFYAKKTFLLRQHISSHSVPSMPSIFLLDSPPQILLFPPVNTPFTTAVMS